MLTVPHFRVSELRAAGGRDAAAAGPGAGERAGRDQPRPQPPRRADPEVTNNNQLPAPEYCILSEH